VSQPVILGIIGSVIAVLLIVAGVDYFILNKPAPPEPIPAAQPAAAPAPTQALPAEQPPVSLQQNLESLKKTLSEVNVTGEAREVTLVISEAEANAQGANILSRTEIPEDIPIEITSVHIDFQTGNTVMTEAETVTLGFEVTIKVKSQVDIIEGKPAVEVTDVNFGFVPVPQSLKDKITELVTQKIDELLSQLTEAEFGINLEYKDINIQEETASITVLVKP